MKIRKGSGYRWRDQSSFESKGGHIVRELNGFTVDDLDKKMLAEAEDIYERVFITIRGVLEKNVQLCCDDETDRLVLCQNISDVLKENYLIPRKEG